MRIPDGPSGFPTLSPTQLRAYGAGGFRLSEQEEPRGCPRQYHARYVERRVPPQSSYELDHGRFVHQALFLMEDQGLAPDEALVAALPAGVTPEGLAEARADIEAYMERGASPVDRYGTIGVELDLTAPLYVDEQFGPTWVRAIVDWIGVDPDQPNLLHVVDYKTNRRPPSTDDIRGDVQLKIQHFVALEYARSIGLPNPVIVMHLDAIKWREVEISYTQADMEAFRDWAETLARAIWRDEQALPVLNPNCDLCPVNGDCPAYADLPQAAKGLLTGLAGLADDEARMRWRDSANAVRLLLQKAVAEIDADFKARGMADGALRVGAVEFLRQQDWADLVDLRSLHQAMADAFYDVVSTTQNKVKGRTASWSPADRAAALACFSRAPVGHTVVKQKIKEGR